METFFREKTNIRKSRALNSKDYDFSWFYYFDFLSREKREKRAILRFACERRVKNEWFCVSLTSDGQFFPFFDKKSRFLGSQRLFLSKNCDFSAPDAYFCKKRWQVLSPDAHFCKNGGRFWLLTVISAKNGGRFWLLTVISAKNGGRFCFPTVRTAWAHKEYSPLPRAFAILYS